MKDPNILKEQLTNEFSHRPSYWIDYEHGDCLDSFIEYSNTEEGKFYLPKFCDSGGLVWDVDGYHSIRMQRWYNPRWQTTSDDYHCYCVFENERHTKYFSINEYEKCFEYFIERIKENS